MAHRLLDKDRLDRLENKLGNIRNQIEFLEKCQEQTENDIADLTEKIRIYGKKD